jgi:hypothetical protein
MHPASGGVCAVTWPSNARKCLRTPPRTGLLLASGGLAVVVLGAVEQLKHTGQSYAVLAKSGLGAAFLQGPAQGWSPCRSKGTCLT